MTPLLAMHGIEKHFPGVQALRGVSFELKPGEVHAVCGENGAGKSTLMHVLAGVHVPDSGTTEIEGRAVRPRDELEARKLGIGMVFQERSLVGSLSVAENILPGRQPVNRWGIIDRGELQRQATTALARLDLEIPPNTPLEDLSPALQQMVEIARALSIDARILVFDEPTAALTLAETDALFAVIRQLRAAGVGIVYISHRLEEVFQIADRVTVLKDGACQGTWPVAGLTPAALIAAMVGRELNGARGPAAALRDPPMLEVQFPGAEFAVRAGEIVALAGLAGAGRTELALSIFGARRHRGQVCLCGLPVRIDSPADAIALGIGYLPEDRREAGLFLKMTVAENVAAAQLRRVGWRLDKAALGIAADLRGTVENLSGGNQQKVMLARWLLARPKVLIVDEPTRGIDVGAKAEVHALFRELAAQGTAIVLISSELPEVLSLADRILVMRAGRIAAELDGCQTTEQEIMSYAAISAKN